MSVYEAHQSDIALDMADIGDLIRVDRQRMGAMITPYWPRGGPILVNAGGRPAYVLPWPSDEEQQRRLDGLIDVLQVLVGPARLNRPVRCHRFVRTRWREIDPRRRLTDHAIPARDSRLGSVEGQVQQGVLVSARRRFQRLMDRW